MQNKSRVPKAASLCLTPFWTHLSNLHLQKWNSKRHNLIKGQPFWFPREFHMAWKQIKPEITLQKTPLIHLHIPDSQALQAPGMLKILHFAYIYKAYLEAIDHSQNPKLSASLICSLSLSSWKMLCAHLTIFQARSGYSSHLKMGNSVPWPQCKHLKEQGWISAFPDSSFTIQHTGENKKKKKKIPQNSSPKGPLGSESLK